MINALLLSKVPSPRYEIHGSPIVHCNQKVWCFRQWMIKVTMTPTPAIIIVSFPIMYRLLGSYTHVHHKETCNCQDICYTLMFLYSIWSMISTFDIVQYGLAFSYLYATLLVRWMVKVREWLKVWVWSEYEYSWWQVVQLDDDHIISSECLQDVQVQQCAQTLLLFYSCNSQVSLYREIGAVHIQGGKGGKINSNYKLQIMNTAVNAFNARRQWLSMSNNR